MKKNSLVLIIVVIGIVVVIGLLEKSKPEQAQGPVEEVVTETVADKESKYPAAKELVAPDGFLNTEPFKLADHIGQDVILVDFWTYSCINCQRTLPYLNAWQEKYGDKGLKIVGVHTPEFEFEKEKENVQAAIDKFGIEYAVVQDNEYSTWRAYANRYWPRKYLIDIDGYIVYDHIGEGSYEETEQKIQELLQERSKKLGEAVNFDDMPLSSDLSQTSAAKSPEVYFGSGRNELLANGQAGAAGKQELQLPPIILNNRLYLAGSWDFDPEYAEALQAGAEVNFRYEAKNVYMVARAETPVQIEVSKDGQVVQEVVVQQDQLYGLIEGDQAEEGLLQLRVLDPGLQIFTFTFG